MPRRFGTRCGKVILPSVIQGEPLLKKPRKDGSSCTCGKCRLCVNRVYSRLWQRKFAKSKSDELLDAESAKWLEENR